MEKTRQLSPIQSYDQMKALVWPVETYGCEARTLRRHVQAFENKCIRTLLRTRQMTKNSQVYEMAKTESELLRHVISRKLCYFCHVIRLPYDRILNSVMLGLVEDSRERRPRIGSLDNTTTLTGHFGANLLRATRGRKPCTALTQS